MASPTINSSMVLWSKLNATNNGQTGGVVTNFALILGSAYGWDTSENAIRSNTSNTGTSNYCGFRLSAAYEAGGAGGGGVTPPATAVDGSSAAGDGKRLFYTHGRVGQDALN